MAILKGFNRVAFLICLAIIPNLLMSAHVGVQQMETSNNCSTLQNGTNCTSDFPLGINGTIPSNGNSEETLNDQEVAFLILGLSIVCGLIFCASTCLVKTYIRKCNSNALHRYQSSSSEIYAPSPIVRRPRTQPRPTRYISRHRYPQRYNERHGEVIGRDFEMNNHITLDNNNNYYSDGSSIITSIHSSIHSSHSSSISSSDSINSIGNISNNNPGVSSTVGNTAEAPATFSAYQSHAGTVGNVFLENSLPLSELAVSNTFPSAIENSSTQAPTKDNPLPDAEESIMKKVEINLSHVLNVSKFSGTGKINTESKVEQQSLKMKNYQDNLQPMASNDNIPDPSADLGLSEEADGSSPRADHGVDMPAENDAEISDDAGELKTEIETIPGGLPEPQDAGETAPEIPREIRAIDMGELGVADELRI